ncbi:MAG: hypothetical protein NTV93_19550 [Verrucomicrobia bacterium]|nr:hypothetical protein [Verrucomicrobiota bacterium]
MKTKEDARELREKTQMGCNLSAINLLLRLSLIEFAPIRGIRGQPAGWE